MAKVSRKPRKPKVIPPPSWRGEAVAYLHAFQAKHVQAFCSLPELYAKVASKHSVSIGQFHDEIRALVQASAIRLHPFSGARSALDHEEYALMMGKEIMYYAEGI